MPEPRRGSTGLRGWRRDAVSLAKSRLAGLEPPLETRVEAEYVLRRNPCPFPPRSIACACR